MLKTKSGGENDGFFSLRYHSCPYDFRLAPKRIGSPKHIKKAITMAKIGCILNRICRLLVYHRISMYDTELNFDYIWNLRYKPIYQIGSRNHA